MKEDGFYCYSCGLNKPIETKIIKPNRKVICTSCNGKRKKPQRQKVA